MRSEGKRIGRVFGGVGKERTSWYRDSKEITNFSDYPMATVRSPMDKSNVKEEAIEEEKDYEMVSTRKKKRKKKKRKYRLAWSQGGRGQGWIRSASLERGLRDVLLVVTCPAKRGPGNEPWCGLAAKKCNEAPSRVANTNLEIRGGSILARLQLLASAPYLLRPGCCSRPCSANGGAAVHCKVLAGQRSSHNKCCGVSNS